MGCGGAAFQGWVTAMYDTSRKDTNYASMSAALEKQVPDTSLVHCWARTHSMVHDVKHCLKRAKGCGVNVTLSGFKKLKDDVFGDDGTSSMHSEHLACHNYFNQSTMHLLHQHEKKLISKFNLGECCSSD